MWLTRQDVECVKAIASCGEDGLVVSFRTPYGRAFAEALSRLEHGKLIYDDLRADLPCLKLTDHGKILRGLLG